MTLLAFKKYPLCISNIYKVINALVQKYIFYGALPPYKLQQEYLRAHIMHNKVWCNNTPEILKIHARWHTKHQEQRCHHAENTEVERISLMLSFWTITWKKSITNRDHIVIGSVIYIKYWIDHCHIAWKLTAKKIRCCMLRTIKRLYSNTEVQPSMHK